MSIPLEILEAEALQLPLAERSQLIEHLISSLETDPTVEAAWDALAEQREASLARGESAPVPASEALARLRARLAG